MAFGSKPHQQAKERRANDPRHLAMKEAAKQRRRAAYQQAKARRDEAVASAKASRKVAKAAKRREQHARNDAELANLLAGRDAGGTGDRPVSTSGSARLASVATARQRAPVTGAPPADERGARVDVAAHIFDLDGTLVDTMRAHHRAWQPALARFGAQLTTKRFHELAGVPASWFIDDLAAQGAPPCWRARTPDGPQKGPPRPPLVECTTAQLSRRVGRCDDGRWYHS